MDKEVIRNLVRWMAQRHNIELDRIRIGSNQKTRYGSASMRQHLLKQEPDALHISISTYNTNGSSEYWNENNKIEILSTIVHEFAHLYFMKDGLNPGHSSIWVNKYHEMLAKDWKELVAMYNILAVDNLDDSWDTMIGHLASHRSYFDSNLLAKLLKTEVNYRTIIKGIFMNGNSWITNLREAESFGFTVKLGNERFIFEKDGQTFEAVKDYDTLKLCE